MNYQDFLITFAQIIGVIVGFANLATVLDRSKISESDWGLTKLRILLITEGGLFTIGACFTPYLVFFFVGDENLSFKISSLILVFLFASNAVFSAFRFKNLVGKLGWFQKGLLYFCGTFGCIPLVIGLLAPLSPRHVIALYCFSISSVSILLAVVFVRLFRSIVK